MNSRKRPNVIFVFGDQWRAQSVGYAGDENAITPTLDKLESESINFTNAISGCPVCTPYRASLITGQFVTTHGLFMNDVQLSNKAVSIAQAFTQAGYNTAYIGKWHINNHGRSKFIPRENRQGFEYWKVLECTHDYNNSFYFGDENKKLKWDGYDAAAQTNDAIDYINRYDKSNPFFMVLSWGPPHDPYETAPEKYRKLFDADNMKLRPNVPPGMRQQAKEFYAGYYAHIAAMDDCMKSLLECLDSKGISEDTILVFTSDHGDMLGSQNRKNKQVPWDESIRVPFLMRYPSMFGTKGRHDDRIIDAPDIMPTLLGLCDIAIPETVEGYDYSGYLQGGEAPADNFGLICCIAPFGQYTRNEHNGREYRGIRTTRYTYVRDLKGPWLLYDNEKDPYQQENLCNIEQFAEIQDKLDKILNKELSRRGDNFEPAENYIKRWGYTVDETGTVPFEW